jgi:hypothetical protein
MYCLVLLLFNNQWIIQSTLSLAIYLVTYFFISDDFEGDALEKTLNVLMPVSLYIISYQVEKIQLRLFFENKDNQILHQEMKNILEAIPEAIIIVNKEEKSKEVVFRNHNMDSLLESLKLPDSLNQTIFRSINDYFNNSASESQENGDGNY